MNKEQFMAEALTKANRTIEALVQERDRLANELLAAEIRIENDGMELAAIKGQEPVAMYIGVSDNNRDEVDLDKDVQIGTKLYLAAGAQPAQEQSATHYWIHKEHCFQPPYDHSCKYGDKDCPMAAPAQAQERKPIDDAQIRKLWEQEAQIERSTANFVRAFARAIEAKIKEQL